VRLDRDATVMDRVKPNIDDVTITPAGMSGP
jgi:hypothetical protein